MKYKNRKRYFVYTSIILYLYFLTFSEMKYTSNILLSLKRNNLFKKSTSSILQSLHINTSILKVYFKYTSKIEKKYFNFKNQLPAYFQV